MLNSRTLKLFAVGVLASGVAVSAIYALNVNNRAQNSASEISTTRYEADLMEKGRASLSAIAQSADLKGKNLQTEIVLEKTTVTDLNGDGYPEVFGLFRQGLDPNSPAAARQTAQDATLYATVWLSYSSANQPPIAVTGMSEYVLGKNARPPYQIEAIADLDGDGKKEVIVHSREDNPGQFRILEYRNGVLVVRMASPDN